MARINTVRYLFVAACLIGSLSFSLPAQAQNGGGTPTPAFLGLDENTQDNASKTPSYVPQPVNPQAQTTETPGILTSSPSASGSPPAPGAPPQYTPSPNDASHQVINDLGVASAVYGPGAGVKPPTTDFSSAKHLLINGKPAVVAVTEFRIKQAKETISDKNLSSSDREKKGKAAYKELSDMATGLRLKEQIPDSIYKSLKLPDDYIKDERDGNAAALKELDAALDDLKSYQ